MFAALLMQHIIGYFHNRRTRARKGPRRSGLDAMGRRRSDNQRGGGRCGGGGAIFDIAFRGWMDGLTKDGRIDGSTRRRVGRRFAWSLGGA